MSRPATKKPFTTQRSPAILSGLLVLGAIAAAGLPCAGQTRVGVPHTVDGIVVNANNQPIAGAVVYLENPKSLDVQSYLTDGQGSYHFNHILPQTDYDVWAEQNGVESKHKFISQFSSHVNFHIRLKIQPGRKKFLGIF